MLPKHPSVTLDEQIEDVVRSVFVSVVADTRMLSCSFLLPREGVELCQLSMKEHEEAALTEPLCPTSSVLEQLIFEELGLE